MGDIAVLDESKDVGATNRRQLAALYCGATSGFEVEIHWLLYNLLCYCIIELYLKYNFNMLLMEF